MQVNRTWSWEACIHCDAACRLAVVFPRKFPCGTLMHKFEAFISPMIRRTVSRFPSGLHSKPSCRGPNARQTKLCDPRLQRIHHQAPAKCGLPNLASKRPIFMTWRIFSSVKGHRSSVHTTTSPTEILEYHVIRLFY
jgi:hypothetical protein